MRFHRRERGEGQLDLRDARQPGRPGAHILRSLGEMLFLPAAETLREIRLRGSTRATTVANQSGQKGGRAHHEGSRYDPEY